MGTGLEVILPLALSAVSAGASYVNTRNQAKSADRLAAQQLTATNQRQARADQVSAALSNRVANSTPKEEKANRMSGYMEQLQKAKVDSLSGLPEIAGASDTFRRDSANAALGVEGFGSDYADTASVIDAAGDQRRGERKDMARSTLDLGMIQREQQGSDRIFDLKARSIRGNPWLQALSQVAGAAAGATAGMGAGGWSNAGAGASSIVAPQTGGWAGGVTPWGTMLNFGK